MNSIISTLAMQVERLWSIVMGRHSYVISDGLIKMTEYGRLRDSLKVSDIDCWNVYEEMIWA